MFNKPSPVEVASVGSSFRDHILGADCDLCPDTPPGQACKRGKGENVSRLRRVVWALWMERGRKSLPSPRR